MEHHIIEIIRQFKEVYQELAPAQLRDSRIEKASLDIILQFEAQLEDTLPQDYRYFLLHNDFAISFEANFDCLSIIQVMQAWRMMNRLLDDGTFDDGRIVTHEREGFGNWSGDYLQRVWWHRKWVPFAKDSCGNMKCLDLAPGVRGNKYQLIDMETQDSQGPFYNRRYHSFLDYLEKHLTYLHRKQYDFTEYWDGSLMLEIDGYKSPQ